MSIGRINKSLAGVDYISIFRLFIKSLKFLHFQFFFPTGYFQASIIVIFDISHYRKVSGNSFRMSRNEIVFMKILLIEHVTQVSITLLSRKSG